MPGVQCAAFRAALLTASARQQEHLGGLLEARYSHFR